jgi:hypothetical protein
LVQRARERRDVVDRSVRGYRTLVKEHWSIGVRAVGRDRILYRRETAARLDWRRDGPLRVDVLGARDVSIAEGLSVPGGLENSAPYYAFEPSARELLIGLNDSSFTRHPLARGSEADYRFRSGDTVSLRLPDGTAIRVVELRVLPRRRDPKLVDGSLWLDTRTYAVTRALYRPAAVLEAGANVQRKGRSVTVNAGPGVKRRGVIGLPRARAEARYITVEYGLHRQQWWMPRLIAVEGVAEVGSLVTTPFRLERTYSEYQLEASLIAAGDLAAAPADSAMQRCPKGATNCMCTGGRCRRFEMHVPSDTAALLTSPHLPESIFADQASVMTSRQAEELAEELRRIVPVPVLSSPEVSWNVGPGVSRFNRVEGLAPGVRSVLDFKVFTLDATAHLGTANWQPSLLLGATRETGGMQHRLAAYYRLDTVYGAQRALGLGNSLSALLWGRDDGDYFRSGGVELTGAPARTEQQWFDWRLFAERQTEAAVEADWSLRHLWDGDYSFRPNIQADRANQAGAAVTLRAAQGLDPRGFSWGVDVGLEGSTGTFDFARPSLTLRSGIPLPGSLMGALELAGGTALGTVPAQSLWYLGGTGTLRGYGGNSARGDTFWRGRGEVAGAAPLTRIALFSDVGWAGSRDAAPFDRPLWSAGVGASLLDGLIRFDIARALVAPTGWRADLYFNAAL